VSNGYQPDGVTGPPARPRTSFRELHPVAQLVAGLLCVALVVVVLAVLTLGGRWGWWLFLAAWHAADGGPGC
jgi:hypothetical protein